MLKIEIPEIMKNDVRSVYKLVLTYYDTVIEKERKIYSTINALTLDNHISNITKKKIKSMKYQNYLKQKHFFVMAIEPYLKKMKEIMEKPVKVSFCYSSVSEQEEKKNDKLVDTMKKEFWTIVEKYVRVVFKDHIVKKQQQTKDTSCQHCGHDKMIYLEFWKVCENCATAVNVDNFTSSFQDVKRVKIFLEIPLR